jgi:hypothetical protein
MTLGGRNLDERAIRWPIPGDKARIMPASSRALAARILACSFDMRFPSTEFALAMADSASMSQRHDGVFPVKRLVLRVH